MIFAAPTSVPQMHSHDYLLRLTRDELDSLVLSHLFTVDDPAVLADAGVGPAAGVRGGYTEWQGTVGGHVVSLAWDWIQLADGAFQILPAVSPRTNVRLLDSKGYDSAPAEESDALWQYVARIDWRTPAAEALVAGSADMFPSPSWDALHQH